MNTAYRSRGSFRKLVGIGFVYVVLTSIATTVFGMILALVG